ncbi:hypothetical protein J22TS3_20260 [Paenibacillus sp. J22TS3]|nr:hypothetical protein J22TS3_20260 [Paenibacillus sp. J22TS3]
MRLGIMQPYFFPYIGYFQLINYVDQWVVFDDAQYIRHGWVNRNRILHPLKEWQYIIVPLSKHKHTDPIKDISLNPNVNWKQKILGQLTVYRKATQYNAIIKLIKEIFEIDVTSLSLLNVLIMERICQYLEIPFSYIISSQTNLNYTDISDSGDWALEISKQLGATEYVNPMQGEFLFDKNKFDRNDIKLSFLKPKFELLQYDQGINNREHEPSLSILDVLMFNDREIVRQMLKYCEVI